MNIQQLITSCKKHNRQAEKALFFRFAGKVLTICRRYTRDDQKAQDYVQECFIQVFQNIDRYDENKGEFAGWLYRICTNTVLQLLRKEKRQVDISYPEKLPEIAQENVVLDFDDYTEEKIISLIRQLPDRYRQVFNLSVLDGWSHREIAAALNISESTSRSQLTRAKKMLQVNLQKKIKLQQA